jgi:hypothetical protein
MKIAVVTQYDEVIRAYGALTADNKLRYSNQHGYAFICHQDNLAFPRPAAWSKIPLLLRHLAEFDWLFWTDADSLVMNPAHRLEDITAKYAGSGSLLITEDFSGLNTGNMLLRSCEWTRQMLTEAWNQTQFLAESNSNWEQPALISVLEQDVESRHQLKRVPQRVMNSYLQAAAPHAKFTPGDFILHLAGWREIDRVTATIRGLLRRTPCESIGDARAWTRSLAEELLELLPGDAMLERTLSRNR